MTMGSYKTNEEKLNDCNTSNIWYVIHYVSNFNIKIFNFIIKIYLFLKTNKKKKINVIKY